MGQRTPTLTPAPTIGYYVQKENHESESERALGWTRGGGRAPFSSSQTLFCGRQVLPWKGSRPASNSQLSIVGEREEGESSLLGVLSLQEIKLSKDLSRRHSSAVAGKKGRTAFWNPFKILAKAWSLSKKATRKPMWSRLAK